MKRLHIGLKNIQCYKSGRSLMVQLNNDDFQDLEELITNNLPEGILAYKNFTCDIDLDLNIFEPKIYIDTNYDLKTEEVEEDF